MQPIVTFVYAYYENPGMFEIQQKTWATYTDKQKARLEVIVTDDCSSNSPARDHLLPDTGVDLSLYEITEKVKWNWLECRNIGAHYAKGRWLLLTDMDHVVSPSVIAKIMKQEAYLEPRTVYQFGRVKAPDMSWYKFHNDSFFLTKELFWQSGGYDEDFSGLYGTSGMFRNRLFMVADRNKKWDDLPLILYGREVQPDASTVGMARKEGRDPEAIRKMVHGKKEQGRDIQRFVRPYRKVKVNG